MTERAGGRAKQEAAVLVPVHRSEQGDLRLILVRRSEGGIHGGQLAFPGGKPEPTDRSLLDTALRETREEIGLGPESIEILTELPMAETMMSGFRVLPFLARVDVPSRWSFAAHEIAEIMDVSIAALARPEARGRATEHLPQWPAPREIEFYRVGPYRMWGLTFRIVEPLIPRLLSGEWAL